jgi:hypothetical protein
MKSHLVKTLRLPERKAELVASLSWGSMSSAFFWMDDENFTMRRRLAELVIGKKKGFVTATGLSEIITGDEKGLRFYLCFLLSLFRDLWVLNQAGDTHGLVNSDLRELLETNTWDGAWIERSIYKVQEALESLRYNINRWLAFEHLALSIMR